MNKIKTIDFLIASIIFIVAIVEILTFIMSNISIEHYADFWFPVSTTVVILFLTIEKIANSFRFKSCIYTKIIAIVFAFIQFFNLLAYFIKFGLNFYSEWVYPLFLITILFIVGIKISRSLFYKETK